MNWRNKKCVMVIDESLPPGIIANTAAIMGITLGKKIPEVVGADVADQNGNEHLGIIEFPVPILRGTPKIIRQIRERLYQPDFQDLTVVDFSDLAQGCKTYDEFIKKWDMFPNAHCSIWVLPSVAQRKRSIGLQAVCLCCGKIWGASDLTTFGLSRYNAIRETLLKGQRFIA